MFFTRSLRRKMVCGLALVLAMMSVLSLSGISGLRSYGQVVDDLDFSINQAPRKGDLVAAISLLFEPLSRKPKSARFQQRAFAEQLTLSEQRILDFRRKLDAMPQSPAALARKPVFDAILAQVDYRMGLLQEQQELLGDESRRPTVTQSMLEEVVRLQVLVQDVPDPQEGLASTLRHAKRVYRSRLWMVSVSSALSVLLFLGLILYGYLWIFAPIQKLHRGAQRVAQGDFDYRVELPSPHDEMAELADSFNKMTARFQEITSNLDRQVEERSRQLVRSERLAGIGFLSAGVAHEINNPLSAIAMAAESLVSRAAEILKGCDKDEAEVTRQYLEMIQREAFRCQEITARLLNFARGQSSLRSTNDLTRVISEVLAMVHHMSKYQDRHIQFTRTAPCEAQVNGTEIKQVVLNLIANALDSMESGQTLRIDVAEQTDAVIMTFADEGCGMTQEVIDNLFEPFFTKKQSGKGTGLGLSISNRIISDHGGTIEAASNGPGQGSTFRIHLPRKAAASEAA